MILRPDYLYLLWQFLFGKVRNKIAAVTTGTDHFSDSLRKENALLLDAASKLGIAVTRHSGGMLEFSYRGRSSFLRANITELDPAISLKMASDKQLSAELLQRVGLPVPTAKDFTRNELKKAEDFRNELGGIAVVKPRRGTSSGIGITAGLANSKDMRRAFYEASFYDSRVMVEEFVPGDNIRLLVLGNTVVSAVKRIPATVIGDGKSTIKKLIRLENARRLKSEEMPKLWEIAHTRDLGLTLKRHSLSLRSIPPNGMAVQVKTICNGHQGGTVEEVTSRVHPDFLEMAVKAAKTLGIVFGGVDLITPDISVPADERSKINEVNTTPSIYGHYLAYNRDEIRDSAGALLRFIFDIDQTSSAGTRK
ncbi:MAG: hypothetical protein ACRBF0_03915 [Calditrichia bacterium]